MVLWLCGYGSASPECFELRTGTARGRRSRRRTPSSDSSNASYVGPYSPGNDDSGSELSGYGTPRGSPAKTMSPARLTFGDKIGEGEYSIVYEGTLGNKAVAIKAIERKKPANRGRDLEKDFNEEVSALERLQHPHCLKLIRASNLTIVTDISAGKPMDALLYKDRTRFDPSMALAMAQQLASCVAHLHGIPLLHRDLKPENVMVDMARGMIKLIDFGMAQAPRGGAKQNTFDGSPLYGAPEAFEGAPSSFAGEVWSLACVCAEMFSSGRPYSNRRIAGLRDLQNVVKAGTKPFAPLPRGIPVSLQDALDQAFSRVPEDRPRACQLAAAC